MNANRLGFIRPTIAAASLTLLCLAPPAARASRPAYDLSGSLVTTRVLVDGRTAPLFSRPWSWTPSRRYFEAFENGRYALELTNQSNRRIGLLVSVDGLNVVSGEKSNLSSGEAMYVLDAHQSMTLNGWRTSLDEVRQFVFVDERQSYATRTGQANGDMGWIRVLALEENAPQASWGRIRSSYRGGGDGGGNQLPAPSAQAPESAPHADRAPGSDRAGEPAERKSLGVAPDGRELARDETRTREDQSTPGTGWGERRNDPVTRTHFVAMANPTDQLNLRYEYESGLRALGILDRESRVWERERGELGFAQAPRW